MWSRWPRGLRAASRWVRLPPVKDWSSRRASTAARSPADRLACAAALATIGVIEKILPDVSRKGARFAEGLKKYNPRVRGLMIGITIGDKCPEIQKKCAEQGVLVNCAADGNLRLVPPLTITDAEIDRVVRIIDGAIGQVVL